MRLLMLAAVSLTMLFASGDHPNFTGNWKMDSDRSDFGQIPKPATLVRKIEHEDPNVRIITTFSTPANGEVTTDVKHTTDGKESVNTIRGSEVKSTMAWDGNSLELISKRNLNGKELVTKERWTLTNKGKVLTVFNSTNGAQGPLTFTVVMNKE
jgi:hypothetical protein